MRGRRSFLPRESRQTNGGRRVWEGSNLVVGQIVGSIENATWKMRSWGNYESPCPRSAGESWHFTISRIAFIMHSSQISNNFNLNLFVSVSRATEYYIPSSPVLNIFSIILFDSILYSYRIFRNYCDTNKFSFSLYLIKKWNGSQILFICLYSLLFSPPREVKWSDKSLGNINVAQIFFNTAIIYTLSKNGNRSFKYKLFLDWTWS